MISKLYSIVHDVPATDRRTDNDVIASHKISDSVMCWTSE